MFVAMSHAATEAEILGVKSRILAEGLTPYEHAGASGTVLAVVGEVAGLQPGGGWCGGGPCRGRGASSVLSLDQGTPHCSQSPSPSLSETGFFFEFSACQAYV